MKERYIIKNLLRFSAALLIGFLPVSVSGQDQVFFLDTLTRKFLNYCETYPREEIYVHTDREEYVAGEYIWFQIYLFDRQSDRLAPDGTIAYLEILNAENRPVVQKRISVEGGLGSGQAWLPDTLSSGRFMLRTYTNWMKNFMPSNCFMKDLSIYNAINTVNFMNRTMPMQQEEAPGTDSGMSEFAESGIGMSFGNQGKDILEINIDAGNSYRSDNNNLCYMFIETHGRIDYKNSIILIGETTRIQIPRSMLTPGVNQVTLFSSSGKPVDERLIYTEEPVTRHPAVRSTDGLMTRTMEEIEYEMKNDGQADSRIMTMSVSVAPETGNTFMDISDYMIFGSEFGVLPDTIQRSRLSDLSPGVIDRFLATAKSNWIDWDLILSGKHQALKYNPEHEYLSLSGHLVSRGTLEPDSGQYLFLSQPGKKAIFQYARTDREGYFNFSLPVNEMIRDIIIQPEEAERNDLIRMEPSFSDAFFETAAFRETLSGELSPSISRMCANYQVNAIYGNAEAEVQEVPLLTVTEPRTFYGKPDFELNMDDYVRLPVMEEVIFELLDGVQMRKKKSGYEVIISDPDFNLPYDKPPVLFVDGVVVHDPAVIAALDPGLVEKIDVIRARYVIGDYLFSGLVNFITYAGDYSCISLPVYAVRLPYRTAEQVMKFHSPDYSTPESRQSRIPDFRNTLYWNPSATPDNDGICAMRFWSSDLSSDYEIIMQGVTTDGKPVSFRKAMKVEKGSLK